MIRRATSAAAFALTLALALACAAPAPAQPTALETLTHRDQLLGWEAVGLIDLGSDGFCTGTLIATDLVLTAAHCVYGPSGQPVDPGTITFRAGYVGGSALHDVSVKSTVAHPGYTPLTPPSVQNLRHDVALLQLATPIPAALAAPFAIKAPGQGQEVSVVSYARGRAEALSWQRSCDVLARMEGLVALNCDVTFGASGAPVLDRSGTRPQIVSIISSGGPNAALGGEVVAYGMDLPDVVADLKRLLSKGEVLASATSAPGTPTVRRLGTGTGTSRDIGARFVKP